MSNILLGALSVSPLPSLPCTLPPGGNAIWGFLWSHAILQLLPGGKGRGHHSESQGLYCTPEFLSRIKSQLPNGLTDIITHPLLAAFLFCLTPFSLSCYFLVLQPKKPLALKSFSQNLSGIQTIPTTLASMLSDLLSRKFLNGLISGDFRQMGGNFLNGYYKRLEGF